MTEKSSDKQSATKAHDLPAMDLEQDIAGHAREWVVFLACEEVSADDRQRFERWLALDDRHRDAYREAEAVWLAAASLESLKAVEPLASGQVSLNEQSLDGDGFWQRLLARLPFAAGADNENRVQSWWQAGIALASLGVVALLISQLQPGEKEAWVYSTAVAETRSVSLPDGSVLSLSPMTQLNVVFSDKLRQVVLVNGEAFFDVAPNPRRPFEVSSGYTRVRVLGTQFNVNSNAYGVTVSVEEGLVQVKGVGIPGRSDSQKKLTAGQRVLVSQERGIGRLQRIDPDSAGAWRRDVRSYQSMPLNQVLADLARYQAAELVVVDEALGQLPVTAVFPTDNSEQMLMALESILPIHIEKVSEGRFEIQVSADD